MIGLMRDVVVIAIVLLVVPFLLVLVFLVRPMRSVVAMAFAVTADADANRDTAQK